MNKEELVSTLKYAFPKTIPVLIGYLFLGMAYGILMKAKGFSTFLAIFMSMAAYCGRARISSRSRLPTRRCAIRCSSGGRGWRSAIRFAPF